MLLDTIFTTRKDDEKYNTSYPLQPSQWKPYKIKNELDFSDCPELSFYIHIPFCQHLCRFCEYQRMLVPDHTIQLKYLDGLKHDIDSFLKKYPSVKLRGFDIGGGTPTALDEESFSYLMDIYSDTIGRVSVSDDFEPSIEGTFQTLTRKKIDKIVKAGIKRVSLGIQSSVKRIQRVNGRINPNIKYMADSISMLHELGIEKVNLDLMYGLKGQTIEDLTNDIACVRYLLPEQVTLYELRTNMIHCNGDSSKDQLFGSYKQLYTNLVKLGYHAQFGQNTFSKDSFDIGLSSYLRHRMLNFLPYKGFGLSAQSLSTEGISYNIGKQSLDLKNMVINSASYPTEDCYLLPSREMLSKYIAISGYFGRFSLLVANRILGTDFLNSFSNEVKFCLDRNLMMLVDKNLVITSKGFAHYGAVFSLFFESPL